MTFKVIPPMLITSAMVTSSSVAEPDTGEVVYNGETTYAVDAQVISTTTHRKFQSLQDENLGKPLPIWPEKQTLWWIDIGPTRKMAMFDVLKNTATSHAGSLAVTFSPGERIDSLALRGMAATSASVVMNVGGSPVYTYAADLNLREVRDWYDYFFADFATRPNLTLYDLPPYSTASITVTLANTTGDAACASLVVGQYVDIGNMLSEPESDVRNFSVINRDPDGTAELIPSRNIPTLVSSILCEKAEVNRIRALRILLNAAPAVWSGIASDSDGYAEAVDILGIYTRFSISLKHQSHAVISLALEEI